MGVKWRRINPPARWNPSTEGGAGRADGALAAAGGRTDGRVELRSRWPGKQRIRRDRIARDERRPSIQSNDPSTVLRAGPARAAKRTHPPRRFRSAQGMGHRGGTWPRPHATPLVAPGSACAGRTSLASRAALTGFAAAPRRGPPVRSSICRDGQACSRGEHAGAARCICTGIFFRRGTERNGALRI